MVEHLEIRGTKHPVRIGYYVMKTVQQETGKGLMEALEGSDEDITVHETILWAALKMGAYAESGVMDIPFDREEMPFVLDECYYDYLELFESEKFFPKQVKAKAAEFREQQRKRNGQSGGPGPEKKLSRRNPKQQTQP